MFNFPHVGPDLNINILFERLTPQIGSWIWKKSSAHYASGVEDFIGKPAFLNIFKGDLYFDALIIRLF